MRIAMIGPFGLSPKGTMSARALPLARELAVCGQAVKILMPPWHTPDERARCWEEAGVVLEYVALGPGPPPFSYVVVASRLLRRALAWQPDVVHCFKPKAYSGLVAWLFWQLRRLRLAGAHLVIDEDDWEGPGGWNDLEPYPHLLRRAFAWQERWGLLHNDGVTVASRALQSIAWSLGVAPGKVYYLPNGASSPRQGDGGAVRARHRLAEAPVMLLYTRFFEYNVARVLAVFRHVLTEIPSVRLLVVGKGLFPQDDARFDRLVGEASLDAQVVRAGWVPQDQTADYFAAADVALCPADDTLVNRTKCSAKLADLLSAGVPVVADAVGQSKEYILHNETGLLVGSGDVEAMARETIRLLRDETMRQRLGSAAASHAAEHSSWSVLARELVRAYERVSSRDS